MVGLHGECPTVPAGPGHVHRPGPAPLGGGARDTGSVYSSSFAAAADYWAAADGAPSREDWAADPLGWARAKARLTLWSRQREVMTAVGEHRRVAVRSCNSAGKTAVAAAVAAWWIDSHPPGDAFVLTSAPTGSQVKVLLWREINRLHRAAGLAGRTNLTEWYIDGELVAFGRKPSEHDAAAFLGTHALHILVIFDEADGIPAVLWAAAESVASNRHARILAIGNPHDPDSSFAKVCAPGSGWHVIGIGFGDTPNFTGEEVSPRLADLLISPEWVTERATEWGADSALYSAMCLGQFPDRGADAFTVIPWAMASRCRLLDLEGDGPHEAGIDVGAGGDETVFAERRGPRIGVISSFRDADPMATVGRLVHAITETGVDLVRVDVTGIGWGIYGRLRELSAHHHPDDPGTAHGAQVVGVNFGARARQPARYANRRAELWWHGRELSRTGAWDLGGVEDAVLGELCAVRYLPPDSKGRIRIEPKDDVIARLGRSPDRADAILLAFDTAPAAEAEVGAVEAFANAQPLTGGPDGRASPFGAPATPVGVGTFGRARATQGIAGPLGR